MHTFNTRVASNLEKPLISRPRCPIRINITTQCILYKPSRREKRVGMVLRATGIDYVAIRWLASLERDSVFWHDWLLCRYSKIFYLTFKRVAFLCVVRVLVRVRCSRTFLFQGLSLWGMTINHSSWLINTQDEGRMLLLPL